VRSTLQVEASVKEERMQTQLKISDSWSRVIMLRYKNGWTLGGIVQDLRDDRNFFRDHGLNPNDESDAAMVNEELVRSVLGI
jgi:hypothetical protein